VGERGAAAAAIETQDAEIAGKIEVASHAIADLEEVLRKSTRRLPRPPGEGGPPGLSIMDAQRKTRAGLVEGRNREAGSLAGLKAERASLVTKGQQAETEAVRIRYVAEFVGADTDSERAIRWLIALMVLCCDPLAIALTAAAFAHSSPPARSCISVTVTSALAARSR
jgi:hypothetical protein